MHSVQGGGGGEVPLQLIQAPCFGAARRTANRQSASEPAAITSGFGYTTLMVGVSDLVSAQMELHRCLQHLKNDIESAAIGPIPREQRG